MVASTVLIVAFAQSWGTERSVRALNDPPWTSPTVGFALLIAITSYVGFESASTVAREARNPLKAVPDLTGFALGHEIGVLIDAAVAPPVPAAARQVLAELRLTVRFGVHLAYFTNTAVRLADVRHPMRGTGFDVGVCRGARPIRYWLPHRRSRAVRRHRPRTGHEPLCAVIAGLCAKACTPGGLMYTRGCRCARVSSRLVASP